MVERAIKRFIDVEVRRGSPATTRAGFGVPLVITNNILLSTARRVRSFTTASSVGEFFGTTSEEYNMAVAYFAQDPFNTNQPQTVKYGAYDNTGRAALLEMGDSPLTNINSWKAVTDGEFSVNIDGTGTDVGPLDFSNVTSLDDVASVINDDLGTEGECYFLVNRFNIKSPTIGSTSTIGLLTPQSGGTGTDISGSGFLDGDTAVSPTNPGGSYISPGSGSPATLTTGAVTDGIANLIAVSNGEFKITVNGTAYNIAGIDLTTATTAETIVPLLQDAIDAVSTGLVVVSWVSAANTFVFTTVRGGQTATIGYLDTVDTPSGTDITGNTYLKGTQGTGAVLSSPGEATETFPEALIAIENIDNDWYAMDAVPVFRDTTDIRAMADEIESRRKMFFMSTNDTNTLVSGNTSSYGYYIFNAGYDRSNAFYHTNATYYQTMSWLGLQLPKDLGSTNWAYQTLAGIAEGAAVNIDPDVLTEAQKDAAQAINVTLYTETLGANFTYFGRTGSGQKINTTRDIDFLQARIEEDLLNLFIQTEIVPYTNAGISIVDNQLRSSLDTWGVKQGILVDGSVETSFPLRSEVSVTDREAGILPDGTFTAQLQGTIDTVIIRGTVYL